MSATLKEMLETQQRLADAVFTQSAAANKLTAAIERLVAPFEQVRRDVYDVKNDREIDVRMYMQTHQASLDGVAKQLTILSETLRRMPGDVTGAFLAQKDERTTAERVFDRLERSSTSTKVWVLILLLTLAASGWLTHLVAG
jgi:hypothetical protein